MLNTGLVEKLETLGSLSNSWRTGTIEINDIAPGDCVLSTSELTLNYALAPVSKRYRSGNLAQYNTGTGWMVPSGINIHCGYETSSRSLRLILPLQTLRDVLPEGQAIPDLPVCCLEDPTILQLILNLYDSSQEDDAYSALYRDTMTLALASHLYRAYARIEDTTTQHRDPRLNRVIEYIEDNLEKQITLDELANVATMSRYHFAKMFKDLTELPPHRFLAERRIEKAKSLLMTSRDSTAEIAYQVGYNSQSNFTQTFRRLTGITPAKYRGVKV
ncbi:AraC family transcriptional regulator [uncultured Kiloniella sp.]|uniref:helix-turn-helix domain-containing protein n=1 Tax=uncultured Kiloniella sp. TaxID=1133091 RepID=UPI002629A84A|nr:AraC family transcriptional regulator [uncultured Kiloniella sp.]